MMQSMTGLKDSKKAGLQIAAEQVRAAGREGDSVLVHMSPDELRTLQLLGAQTGDDVSINPDTGLPEAFSLSNVMKVVAPIVAAIAGTSVLGNPLGGAALSAGATKLTGGSWKDAAINGGLAYAIPTIGGAVGTRSDDTNFFDRLGDRVSGSFENLGGDFDRLGRELGLSALGSEGSSGLGSESAYYDSTRDLWGKMGNSSDGGGLEAIGDRLKNSFSDKGNLLALGVPALAAGMAPDEATEPAAAAGTAASGVSTPYEGFASNYEPMNRSRKDMSDADYYTYGERPSFQYFEEINPAPKLKPKEKKARGGLSMMGAGPQRPPRLVKGPGAGQDDQIPAMLSDGEYVMDAATVSDIGDGSTEAGAKRLDQFRQNIRKKKRGSGKFPPKTGALTRYLGGKV